MTTLAPKLPFRHPFAGGYPRLGGQPLPTDPDAIDYLERVAAADGAAVEQGVAMAVDAFVKGCKADSAGYAGDPTRTVWDALQACCIMAGARTLSGALVPLKGTAPTPYNLTNFDYDRSTGLKGDGSTTYLDSNRANDADGISDRHISCYVSSATSTNVAFMGSVDGVSTPNAIDQLYWYAPNAARGYLSSQGGAGHAAPGLEPSTASFVGASRNTPDTVTARATGLSVSASSTASSGLVRSIFVFGRNYGTGVVNSPSDATLAFYSIGSSLDLAAMDNRVSTLISAIAAALS